MTDAPSQSLLPLPPPHPGLTDYELRVLADLTDWQQQAPGWGTRLLAKPSGTAAKAVQNLVPEEALRYGLEQLNRVAHRFEDRNDVLKRAGVADEAVLARQSLAAADHLAERIARRAMLLGGAGGAVLGVTGVAGMVIDIPALLTLALRTIHRTSYCYGAVQDADQRQRQVIGIFALASANSLAEKQSALLALAENRDVVDDAWRDGIERVAEREMAKEAAAFSLQTLASRVGWHLGARKGAGVVPLLGAVVGSSMNAWYVHDVARTARRVFQWRRLVAAGAVDGMQR